MSAALNIDRQDDHRVLAFAYGLCATSAMSARDMAALLRGEARENDGAAIALFARLGLSTVETLTLLPAARAIAGAPRNPGA